MIGDFDHKHDFPATGPQIAELSLGSKSAIPLYCRGCHYQSALEGTIMLGQLLLSFYTTLME